MSDSESSLPEFSEDEEIIQISAPAEDVEAEPEEEKKSKKKSKAGIS